MGRCGKMAFGRCKFGGPGDDRVSIGWVAGLGKEGLGETHY
jgi:hypothetical protein